MSLVKPDGSQTPAQEDLVRLSPTGEPLSPFVVMLSYSNGVFPWLFTQAEQQCWWSFEPRCVLYPSELHVNRSLKKTIRRNVYRITADTAFEQLARKCVSTRAQSWITEEMHQIFTTLHHLGHVHSVETWRNDELVGGLFGLAIGRMFSGISMFSTAPDASKVALSRLCQQMKAWEMPLLDCQVQNPFLRQMGAKLIPRRQFHRTVRILVRGPPIVGSWTPHFK